MKRRQKIGTPKSTFRRVKNAHGLWVPVYKTDQKTAKEARQKEAEISDLTRILLGE